MLPPGSKAPAFHLPALGGATQSLSALLADGPAVVVFFKVNCPTCQLTMPFVQRLADSAKLGAPRLVAISQNDAKDTESFHQHFGIRVPTLLDDAANQYAVSNAFRIDHVPTFFSLQPDGTVTDSFTGFIKTELEALGKRFGVDTFRPNEQVPALKPG